LEREMKALWCQIIRDSRTLERLVESQRPVTVTVPRVTETREEREKREMEEARELKPEEMANWPAGWMNV